MATAADGYTSYWNTFLFLFSQIFKSLFTLFSDPLKLVPASDADVEETIKQNKLHQRDLKMTVGSPSAGSREKLLPIRPKPTQQITNIAIKNNEGATLTTITMTRPVSQKPVDVQSSGTTKPKVIGSSALGSLPPRRSARKKPAKETTAVLPSNVPNPPGAILSPKNFPNPMFVVKLNADGRREKFALPSVGNSRQIPHEGRQASSHLPLHSANSPIFCPTKGFYVVKDNKQVPTTGAQGTLQNMYTQNISTGGGIRIAPSSYTVSGSGAKVPIFHGQGGPKVLSVSKMTVPTPADALKSRTVPVPLLLDDSQKAALTNQKRIVMNWANNAPPGSKPIRIVFPVNSPQLPAANSHPSKIAVRPGQVGAIGQNFLPPQYITTLPTTSGSSYFYTSAAPTKTQCTSPQSSVEDTSMNLKIDSVFSHEQASEFWNEGTCNDEGSTDFQSQADNATKDEEPCDLGKTLVEQEAEAGTDYKAKTGIGDQMQVSRF